MRKTIEIEDSLEEIVSGAIDGVKDELESYLDQNPDTDELPDISNDLDYSGSIHEIVDGAVPIYTNTIKDLWYLYGDEFERAFDSAGIGEKTDEGYPCGWKAAAIYCYIDQEVHKWYNEQAQEIFDDWQEAKKRKKIRGALKEHCSHEVELV